MAQSSSGAGTGDPATQTDQVGTWQTPKGNLAFFGYRAATNDWNVIQSCTTADEYGLGDLSISGWALDIGAHIGGVAIALAIDNPDLRVIAVEPVPDNARLLAANVARNALGDRIVVLDDAAGGPSDDCIDIAWGFRGSELAIHHAFIGNATLTAGADHETTTHRSSSLDDLLLLCDGAVDFVKIDCEGCEARFLASPAVAQVREFRGEWHPPHIDEAGIVALLNDTHHVTTWGPGPGGFRAVRR